MLSRVPCEVVAACAEGGLGVARVCSLFHTPWEVHVPTFLCRVCGSKPLLRCLSCSLVLMCYVFCTLLCSGYTMLSLQPP